MGGFVQAIAAGAGGAVALGLAYWGILVLIQPLLDRLRAFVHGVPVPTPRAAGDAIQQVAILLAAESRPVPPTEFHIPVSVIKQAPEHFAPDPFCTLEATSGGFGIARKAEFVIGGSDAWLNSGGVILVTASGVVSQQATIVAQQRAGGGLGMFGIGPPVKLTAGDPDAWLNSGGAIVVTASGLVSKQAARHEPLVPKFLSFEASAKQGLGILACQGSPLHPGTGLLELDLRKLSGKAITGIPSLEFWSAQAEESPRSKGPMPIAAPNRSTLTG